MNESILLHEFVTGENGKLIIKLGKNFKEFKENVFRQLPGKEKDKLLLCTTDRDEINEKNFQLIESGDTLLLLKNKDQELPIQLNEKINFEPHYDVLVKSGLYEYYASKGRKPLPYALAELIDNALSATANNGKEKRSIDLRFYVDSDKPQNSVILVIDNGCGMKSQDLANWAKYKYSKFNRVVRDFANNQTSMSPRSTTKKGSNDFPRYLNSQISYFGAGGKQAVFFIGNAVRMISKSKMSKDVHELFLSEAEFKKKSANHEKIFETTILNRQVGDASHIGNKIFGSEVLRRIISEENNENFTCVAITEVFDRHIESLTSELNKLATELSHIYHYYLHGPDGNIDQTTTKRRRIPEICSNLEITLSQYDITKLASTGRSRKANGAAVNLDKPLFTVNLRDIEDDMQTKYVRSAASSFEFKAEVRNANGAVSVVEGVLRYHPFLYDKETYPIDAYSLESNEQASEDEPNEVESVARGSRPIFECFWNGRLIPYDNVQTLEWCIHSKKGNSSLPPECFNRISGVLWTNDEFEVTQNKLTFKESFEKKLREEEVAFTFLHGSQYRRGIEDNFKKWIENCHQTYDKEIKFLNFDCLIDRKGDPSIPKAKSFPWSCFSAIELSNNTYKKGQKIKTIRTSPIMIGTITKFLVWNDWDLKAGDSWFGTSGYFEIIREPSILFGEKKIYPLNRIDVAATQELIDSFIAKDEERLPSKLEVKWPETEEVKDGSLIKAGTSVGPIQVDVMDKHNKTLNGRLPGNTKKPIHVQLLVHRLDNITNTYIPINQAIATTRSASWAYWFKQIESSVFSSHLGDFKIELSSCYESKEPNGQLKVKKELGNKPMPSKTITFKVVEGDPKTFEIDLHKINPHQRIGVPFNLPITVKDAYNNRVSVTQEYKAEVKCKDVLEASCEGTFVKDGQLFVKKVVVKSKLPSENGKEYTLSVKLEDICKKTVQVKIAFKSGVPAKLQVFPEDPQIIENGTLPKFGGLLFDCCGNPVTHRAEKELAILCSFFDIDVKGNRGNLLCGPYTLDFVTGPDGKECALKGTPAAIQLTDLAKGVQKEIIAELEVKGHPAPHIQKKVFVQASCKPTSIKLFCSSEFDESLTVEITKELEWTAGSMINNIHFKIFDDVGNELQKPNLSQSNVKLSWASGAEVAKSDLKNYRLPSIKVASSTEHIAYQFINLVCVSETNAQRQSVLVFEFTLKPRPGPAAQLKVTMPSSTEVPAGQIFPYDIEVKVADKHMNGVSGISELSCANLKVSCDSAEIDENELVKELGHKEGVILIRNLKFKQTTLGIRNITLQFDDLKEIIVVEAVAGAPKKLKWEFNTQWDGKIVTVSRNGYLDVAVQLYDEYDNKSPVADMKVILGVSKEIEINEPKSSSTNAVGKAAFGHKIFNVISDIKPDACPLNACQSKCYGVFSLGCKASVTSKFVITAGVKIHILCDTTRASKFNIGYAGELDVIAGDEYPSFYVSMLAEDDETTVTAVTLEQMRLELTRDKEVKLLTAASVEDGTYNFENFMDNKSGEYCVKFLFSDTRFVEPLRSDVLKMKILPAAPTSFSLSNPPSSSLFASNTSDANSRRILQGKQLKFVLLDDFQNVVSGDDDKFNGTLTVDIDINWSLNDKSNVNKDEIKIPKFQGNETSLKFDIVSGCAIVSNLMLEEKTPGEDGFIYCLRFTPNISDLKLEGFGLPFIFYNEAEKLFETMILDKKKEDVKKKIQECDTRSQEKRVQLNEMIAKMHEGKRKEVLLQQRLREVGCSGSDVQNLSNFEAIAKYIDSKKSEKRTIEINDQKRMQYTGTHRLIPADKEFGVLGKIGHLALLDDPREARVLSWHLAGDMDCIVTISTEKAKELNARYNGNQQLIPIEGIFRGNLPDWNGLLPHQRIPQLRHSYHPTGNPVSARSLFHFPNEVLNCRTVFGNLLGETIIMDTMSDALEYRKMIVKFSHCPTILTRNGERLRNNSKFGGHGNKMPQNIRYVFEIAPNREIQKLNNQISVLNELNDATRERTEIQKQTEEMEEKVKVELTEIDKQRNDFIKQYEELEAKIRDLRRNKRMSSTPIDSLRGPDGDTRKRRQQ